MTLNAPGMITLRDGSTTPPPEIELLLCGTADEALDTLLLAVVPETERSAANGFDGEDVMFPPNIDADFIAGFPSAVGILVVLDGLSCSFGAADPTIFEVFNDFDTVGVSDTNKFNDAVVLGVSVFLIASAFFVASVMFEARFIAFIIAG